MSACGYCGGRYEQDRCPDCGRQRGALPRPYIVLGPGAMGEYQTVEEAQTALAYRSDTLGPSALYVRVDVAVAFGMNSAMLEAHE